MHRLGGQFQFNIRNHFEAANGWHSFQSIIHSMKSQNNKSQGNETRNHCGKGTNSDQETTAIEIDKQQQFTQRNNRYSNRETTAIQTVKQQQFRT